MRYLRAILLVFFFSAPATSSSQSLSAALYDIGSISVTDYYVDPASGSDSNSGLSRAVPKRTVQSVWNLIPSNSPLSSGYRINLLAGTYTADHLPNYWELKRGTASAPIILQAVDGYGTVSFARDINMANVSYFYLLSVEIKNRTTEGYGDAFHGEGCDHILLRGNSFNGAPDGRSAGGDVAHETVKFNQSQYIYIENNNIQGADDNAIDWVAVQYGHIRGNRLHDASGWCMYVKGGSSYIVVESNIAYNCGEGGITAGQGTGLEFMTDPWTRYEANYIKIVNNVVHDIDGAAFGINGGYGVLVAHNTAYRTGARSHLLEVVFGERSCDGDTATCAALRALGAWGPEATGSENSQYIGNRDVTIANNIFYNPTGYTTGSQHFTIQGPRTPTVGGIPSPQVTDTNLILRGNVVWNGDGSMPLGIEGESDGCQSGNSTCNAAQLTADNRINSLQPDLLDAPNGDFRPTSGGVLEGLASASIADHPAIDSSNNPITEGELSNAMIREFSGASAVIRPPGAFSSSSSSVEFPSPESGGGTPDDDANTAPRVSAVKVTAKRSGRNVALTATCSARDDTTVASVAASVYAGTRRLKSFSLSLKRGKYVAKKTIKTSAKRLRAVITARDGAGLSGVASKTVKVK